MGVEKEKLKYMRRILYIIFLTLFFVLFPSCDSKWGENGDLDGMWQLTQWKDIASGQFIENESEDIYYSFQQKLVKFQMIGSGKYYLSYFTHQGNDLIIGKTVQWPKNEERPLSELKTLGVPADGRFHIDVLNDKNMVLRSETSIISFRKY